MTALITMYQRVHHKSVHGNIQTCQIIDGDKPERGEGGGVEEEERRAREENKL